MACHRAVPFRNSPSCADIQLYTAANAISFDAFNWARYESQTTHRAQTDPQVCARRGLPLDRSFLLGRSITERTWNSRHFRNPTAILLSLELHPHSYSFSSQEFTTVERPHIRPLLGVSSPISLLGSSLLLRANEGRALQAFGESNLPPKTNGGRNGIIPALRGLGFGHLEAAF